MSPTIHTLMSAARLDFIYRKDPQSHTPFNSILSDGQSLVSDAEKTQFLAYAYGGFIQKARQHGRRLILLGQVPLNPQQRGVMRNVFDLERQEVPTRFNQPLAEAMRPLDISRMLLKQFADVHPHVTYVDPVAAFCKGDVCATVNPQDVRKALYVDEHHLSANGSQFLADELLRPLTTLSTP